MVNRVFMIVAIALGLSSGAKIQEKNVADNQANLESGKYIFWKICN